VHQKSEYIYIYIYTKPDSSKSVSLVAVSTKTNRVPAHVPRLLCPSTKTRMTSRDVSVHQKREYIYTTPDSSKSVSLVAVSTKTHRTPSHVLRLLCPSIKTCMALHNVSVHPKPHIYIQTRTLLKVPALSLYLQKQKGHIHVLRCCFVSKSKLYFCHHIFLSTKQLNISIRKYASPIHPSTQTIPRYRHGRWKRADW
jgi:hypothetical protein